MYRRFPVKLLSIIRCPKDSGILIIENDPNGDFISNGSVACNHCGSRYPIEEGILNLLFYNGSNPISEREIIARNKEAYIYHTFGTKKDEEKEIRSTMRHLGDVSGKSIVDFGCGTGRVLVQLIEKAKYVVGIDFSIESLRILTKKIPETYNVGLVLADATRFQADENTFDIVLSTQVIEHLPSGPNRHLFYKLVKDLLKDNGIFVCTVYYHNFYCKLSRHSPDGFHDSGIYYHRFGKRELKNEISTYLQVNRLHPISIHIPFSRRLNLNDVCISIRLEKIPIINSLGELLLVKAVKC